MDEWQTPMLVFDGDCGFCASAAKWAAVGWTDRGQVVSWQELGDDGLHELGLTVERARREAWWIDPRGNLFGGPKAVGKALEHGAGWRHLMGRAILTPPLAWLSPIGYRAVARYRHRLPGSTQACRVR